MANWSALTFGGIDPIATMWERGLARKDAKASQQMQMQYDAQRALELPALSAKGFLKAYPDQQDLNYRTAVDSIANQRAALEQNGFNPLLALGAGLGSAPDTGSQPLVASNSAARVGSGSLGGTSGMSGGPYDIANARQELHNKQKQNELLDAQIHNIEATTRHMNATTAETQKRTEYMGSESFPKLLKTLYDSSEVKSDAQEGSLGDVLYQFKTWMNDKLDDFSRQSLPKSEKKIERQEKRRNDVDSSYMKNFVLPF